jgi:long-subunit fatty acid transport protein
MKHVLVGSIVIAGAVFGASSALAQESNIHNGPVPVTYSFAPPGARSLAMGASFIGLADDATASESNPAGLTILTKPEVSAHFRYSSFDTTVPNTVIGSGFETFTDRVGSPSFFSLVVPAKPAAFSIYYQRAADYKSHSFFDGVIPGTAIPNYDQVNSNFTLENFGFSAALKVAPALSLGASLRLSRASLDSLQRTTFPLSGADGGTLLEGFIDPVGSQSKVTYNAGVLITPTSQVSIGAVYKKGASFDFGTNFVVDFTDGVSKVPVSSQFQPLPVRIPDVFGGGIAIKPTEAFTIVGDVVRIKYSQADPGPDFENIYQQAGQGGREPLADKTEIHVGAEYTWAGGNDWVFALRGGFYTDPDHDGLAGVDSSQDHATVGGGVVVKNRLQIDLAGNFAKYVKEGLLSVVVRF